MDIEPTKFMGLDFRAAPLIASFFGAMAYAIVLKVRSPGQMLAIVLVGMIVSYFLGPLIIGWLVHLGFENVDTDGLQNAAGFISGLSGMAICNGVIAVASRLGVQQRKRDDEP